MIFITFPSFIREGRGGGVAQKCIEGGGGAKRFGPGIF